MIEPTEQIQNRIKELKEENDTAPENSSKICPFMSYKSYTVNVVICLEERCAVWNNYYDRCGVGVRG